MEKYIIDRIEGNFAICECEDKSIVEIEITQIEGNPSEGDVIYFDEQSFLIDKQETERLRKQAIELQDSVFE